MTSLLGYRINVINNETFDGFSVYCHDYGISHKVIYKFVLLNASAVICVSLSSSSYHIRTYFASNKMQLFRIHILSQLFLFITFHEANIIQIKIGLFFPADSTTYQPMMGYNISAGAINLALDRIQQEQLIPNINFRYIMRLSIKYDFIF